MINNDVSKTVNFILPNQGIDPSKALLQELLHVIFSHLSMRELARAALVSKKWKVLSENDFPWYRFASILKRIKPNQNNLKNEVMAEIHQLQKVFDISAKIDDYCTDKRSQEGQQVMIEIAKGAAKENGRSTSIYIRNYRINPFTSLGQQALIEILKLALLHNNKFYAIQVDNYGIKSTPETLPLLKAATSEDAYHKWKVSYEISKYQIDPSTEEGQKKLIEMAKRHAQQDTHTLEISCYISSYEIDPSTEEGQKGLIEIAKLAVNQKNHSLSQYIQNYKINSLQARIEIAKLSAQMSASATSAGIENYEIDPLTSEGQKALIEILLLALRQDPNGTCVYMRRYKINPSAFSLIPLNDAIALRDTLESALKSFRPVPNYGPQLGALGEESLKAGLNLVKQLGVYLDSMEEDSASMNIETS